MRHPESGRIPTPPQIPNRAASTLLLTVTLFGCLCVGTNLAVVLHEAGHAFGALLAGGEVYEITVHPFSGSQASYDVPDKDLAYFLGHGGGFVFGTLFGLILLLLAKIFQRGTALYLLAYTIGTWSMLNGLYLAVGSIRPFGDVLLLIQLGIGKLPLGIAGALLVVTFFALFRDLLASVGLRQSDPYSKWVLVCEGAILPNLLAVPVYHLLVSNTLNKSIIQSFIPFLVCITIVILIAATCGYLLRGRTANIVTAKPQWQRAGIVCIIGFAVIVTELIVF